MVNTIIGVDVKKPAWEQDPKTPLHNRWHPDIPAVARVKEGELFRVECGPRRPRSRRWRLGTNVSTSTPSRRCIDWTGGQIKNDDCADDVKNVDLSQVHYLSGPIAVENAQPGDLLKVELSNLGCLEGDEWGFVTDISPEAYTDVSRDEVPGPLDFALTFRGVEASTLDDQLFNLTLNVVANDTILLDSLDIIVVVPGTTL